MIKKYYLFMFCFFNFMHLQAMKRSDFIDKISQKVNNPSCSTKWNEFLNVFKKYENDNKTIAKAEDIKQFREEICNRRSKSRSKKTKIYKISGAALIIIDEYLKQVEKKSKKRALSCSICLEKTVRPILVGCCKNDAYCYECLFDWYARKNGAKNDLHVKCVMCKKDFSPTLMDFLEKDFRYKSLNKSYIKKEKKEKEEEHFSLAEELYLEELRKLEQGEIVLSDNGDESDNDEENDSDEWEV